MENNPPLSDFQKLFIPGNLEPRIFSYTTRVSNIYQWELEVNAGGLFYKDISGCYSQLKNHVTKQEFSDFWFFGPSMPIPDLETRKWLVDAIREALSDPDRSLARSHFPLFEYPRYANPPMWEDGDYIASNFVLMRDYGLEYGNQNFHDGLVHLDFFPFEYCLTLPEIAREKLGENVWEDIHRRLREECLM